MYESIRAVFIYPERAKTTPAINAKRLITKIILKIFAVISKIIFSKVKKVYKNKKRHSCYLCLILFFYDSIIIRLILCILVADRVAIGVFLPSARIRCRGVRSYNTDKYLFRHEG